jgi:hypothetical protein
MPCVLTPCTTGDADWQGLQNATFTVDAVSDDGLAALNSARYNNVSLSADPFTFTIAEGIHPLVTTVVNGTVGALIRIREVCTDGSSQVLRIYQVDAANDDRTFVTIKGV